MNAPPDAAGTDAIETGVSMADDTDVGADALTDETDVPFSSSAIAFPSTRSGSNGQRTVPDALSTDLILPRATHGTCVRHVAHDAAQGLQSSYRHVFWRMAHDTHGLVLD